MADVANTAGWEVGLGHRDQSDVDLSAPRSLRSLQLAAVCECLAFVVSLLLPMDSFRLATVLEPDDQRRQDRSGDDRSTDLASGVHELIVVFEPRSVGAKRHGHSDERDQRNDATEPTRQRPVSCHLIAHVSGAYDT